MRLYCCIRSSTVTVIRIINGTLSDRVLRFNKARTTKNSIYHFECIIFLSGILTSCKIFLSILCKYAEHVKY